jgi:DNA-binding transcriptional ArsR family regulator
MTFNPSALTQVADYFKVLSELSRLQVLCSLKSGSKNVTEIMEDTGLGQANVSKHLKILAQSGIVSRTPQGVSVYYEIVEPFIFDLCELVSDRLAVRLQEQSQQLKQLEGLRQSETTKAKYSKSESIHKVSPKADSKAKVKTYA